MPSTSDDDPHTSTAQNLDDNEIPIVQHANAAPAQPRNTYTLEWPIFMLFFAWNLSGTVFQNQILFQSCTITLNFNATTCDAVINDASTDEVCRRRIRSLLRFLQTKCPFLMLTEGALFEVCP